MATPETINTMLDDAITAAQAASVAAEAALAELASEEDSTMARIIDLGRAPPSMAEAISAATAEINSRAAAWRETASAKIAGVFLPAKLISLPVLSHVDGDGVPTFSDSTPKGDEVFGISASIRNFTGSDSPVMPDQLAAFFPDLLAERIASWLRDTCSDVFPETSIMPLADRPAEMRRLIAHLETVRAKRKEIEVRLGSVGKKVAGRSSSAVVS